MIREREYMTDDCEQGDGKQVLNIEQVRQQMVGGKVIEVCEVPGRPEVLFVDCADKPRGRSKADTCAIYVKRNATSENIQIGDSLWWQGRNAYWTPQANAKKTCDHQHHYSCQKVGVEYDIIIPRVGYSGVEHPSRQAPNHEQPMT